MDTYNLFIRFKHLKLLSLCFLLSQTAFTQNKWSFISGYLVSDVIWMSPRPSPTPFNQKGAPWELGDNFKPSVREHTSGGLVHNNEIYIYGGAAIETFYASDLWVFDISQQKWAFISDLGGTRHQGTLGIESSTVNPGGRNRMGSAVDNQGNIWFFGGLYHSFTASDLFKYNTSTGKWSYWGEYDGSREAPLNRYRSRMWTDNNGNLWLFGGALDINGNTYSYNDLWKLDLSSNTWTFVSGDKNIYFCKNCSNGSYPMPSDPAGTVYFPKARSDYGYWVDSSGDFWIYGGYAESHGSDEYGDLWKFTVSTSSWTLISGNATFNSPKTLTNPGSRNAPYCWVGNDGKLYMIGGLRQYWYFLSDIWRIDPTTGNWELVKDNLNFNNPPISAGVGVENLTNLPGSCVNTLNHITTGSHTYLFNGYGMGVNNLTGYTGAMWRYSLDGYSNTKQPLAKKDTVVTYFQPEIICDILQNDSIKSNVILSTIDIDINKVGIQDSLTLTSGKFKVQSDGRVLFRPNLNFSGNVSLSYTFQNEYKYISNSAKLSLTVYPCISTLQLISPINNIDEGYYDFISDGNVEMSNKIIGTNGKITVNTRSKNAVVLNPGFVVESSNGTTFKAEISGCENIN